MELLNTSITFAVEAEKLLDSGDIVAAKDLCQSGVSVYHAYPMGWRILAEAYFELDDLKSSQNAIERGLLKFPKYFPLSDFKRIIEETEIIGEVTEDFKESEIILIPDETDDVQTEKSIADEKDRIPPDKDEQQDAVTIGQTNQEQTSFLRLVNNVETRDNNENQLRADNPALIPGLSFAPLRATRKTQANDFRNQPPRFPDMYNPIEDIPDEEFDMSQEDGGIFATDTLATILENQGAYTEAIEVYMELSETNPGKADYYNEKIAELTKKLND